MNLDLNHTPQALIDAIGEWPASTQAVHDDEAAYIKAEESAWLNYPVRVRFIESVGNEILSIFEKTFPNVYYAQSWDGLAYGKDADTGEEVRESPFVLPYTLVQARITDKVVWIHRQSTI